MAQAKPAQQPIKKHHCAWTEGKCNGSVKQKGQLCVLHSRNTEDARREKPTTTPANDQETDMMDLLDPKQEVDEKKPTPTDPISFSIDGFLNVANIDEQDIPKYANFLSEWGLKEKNMHLLTMDQLDRYEQKYQKTHPEFVLVPSDAAAISKAALDWGQAKGQTNIMETLNEMKADITSIKKDNELLKEYNQLFNQRYFLQDYLGGTDCEVYSAIDIYDGKDVVVKISPLEISQQLRNEHHFLTKWLDDKCGVPKLLAFRKNAKYMGLVMTPFGTTLDEYICKQVTVSIPLVLKKCAQQLLETLEFIHKYNIVHCDIKPRNIIVTGSEEFIVIDFGIARKISQDTTITFAGTRQYASSNALAEGNPCFEDDLESLCYTLYSLEIGIEQWKCVVLNRPRIAILRQQSEIVQFVWRLCESQGLNYKEGFTDSSFLKRVR